MPGRGQARAMSPNPNLRAPVAVGSGARCPAARRDASTSFALRARVRWRSAKLDRKSTRLNSSHSQISYAVFCLKKKKRHEPLQRDIGILREHHSPHHVVVNFTHHCIRQTTTPISNRDFVSVGVH